VVVPESAQRIIGLKTVVAPPRQLQAMRRLIGRYEPLPEARQTIASPIAGRLTLLVRSLDRVAKGDALCTIASPELTARAAEIALLQKRLTIYRDLQTPNAALETELAVKQAEYKALLLDAEEKEGAVVLRASCAGQVDTFDVESGAWVEAGAPVLRLIQPQALRFKALIPATEAQALQDRLHVHVEEAHGELRLGIGSENGLTPVYIYFETAPKSARAGAKADVICTMESHETPLLAVPSSAIITVNLQPSVFMRDPHDATRFICVPVTPGLSAAGWTAVEGLPSPTTEVVTDGAYELKLALPGNAQKPAGHFHADGVYHEGEH
jgi:biotin carboxyl carrier protein